MKLDGFDLVTDEDVQMFKHYLELCDKDPVRAFIAYKDQYIIPLRQRLSELELKGKRRVSDREADIEHFIDFIKKLWQGDDITFQVYEAYCKQEKKTKSMFGDTKFYELRPFAIKRILHDELPKHFSLQQAKTIIKENEWRIPPKYIDEALKDDTLFVELPLLAEERSALVGPNDDSPIYGKY